MRRRDVLAGLLATTATSALQAAEPNRVYRLAACEGAVAERALQATPLQDQRCFTSSGTG